VSKSVFNKLRTQTEQRRKQGWSRVEWELLDADNLAKNVKLIQARCVGGLWTPRTAAGLTAAGCTVHGSRPVTTARHALADNPPSSHTQHHTTPHHTTPHHTMPACLPACLPAGTPS
jgi:hypothetical protein